jgi:hypothetical protein
MLLDVNNFGPFQSDVWGTVSEWVTALVTLATAIVIYFTFLYQSEDRKMLRRQNKALINTYIKSQKPKIDLISIDFSAKREKNFLIIPRITFYFKSNQNSMKLLKSEVKFIQHPEHWFVSELTPVFDFVNPESGFNIQAGFKGEILYGPANVLMYEKLDIHFHFTFNDSDDNEYDQTCAATIYGGTYSKSTNEPRLIKQVI